MNIKRKFNTFVQWSITQLLKKEIGFAGKWMELENHPEGRTRGDR